MGMYDTFHNKDQTVVAQLKVGPCLMHGYTEGDSVDSDEFRDGIYHDYGSVVVIDKGVIQKVSKEVGDMEFSHLTRFTKWGGVYNPRQGLDSDNPLVQMLKRSDRKVEAVLPLAQDKVTRRRTIPEGSLCLYQGKVYEFSRIGGTGKAIIHPQGEPDMQSSMAVDPNDLKSYYGK